MWYMRQYILDSPSSQIVDVLLEGGADPNLPLGRGVANALCVLTTHPALRKRDLPTSLALVRRMF
jgi:hypothetical protein